MSKSISIARLMTLVTSVIVAWGIGPTRAHAQGCCPQGGGSPGGGHGGHQSSPMNMAMPGGMSAHQHSAGGGSMCFGSGCAQPKEAEVPTDIIKWPTLLQKDAFASQRKVIETPYRRSPPSPPTAEDYRNMVKAVESMWPSLEWFPTKGVNTNDYDAAEAFLKKLGAEARERYEIASRPTSAHAQAVVVSKPNLKVALAALDKSDQAGIARQRVCPVTGAKLGSMGNPIKVLVGDHPVFLCCAGCVAKVKASPDKYAGQ